MSANISSELSTIASGIYGKDVRSAIHDAIEKINKSFNEDDNVVYDKIDDIRAAFGEGSWADQTITKLMTKGYIVGTGSENKLRLTYTAIRFLRILDRAGVFDLERITPVEVLSSLEPFGTDPTYYSTLKKLIVNGFVSKWDGYADYKESEQAGNPVYDLVQLDMSMEAVKILNAFDAMGIFDTKAVKSLDISSFVGGLSFPSAMAADVSAVEDTMLYLSDAWTKGNSVTMNTIIASRNYFLQLQALYQEGASRFVDFAPIPMGSSLAIPRIEVRGGELSSSWYIEDEILAARSLTITHEALAASGLELDKIYKIRIGIYDAISNKGTATGTSSGTNFVEYTYGTEESPTLDLSTGDLVISWQATSADQIGDRKVTITSVSGCTVSAYLKPIVAVGEDGFSHWSGTRAEYDALGVYDEDTVYLVTGA